MQSPLSKLFVTVICFDFSYRKLGTHGVERRRTAQNKCHCHSRIDHLLTCIEVSFENVCNSHFVNIKTGIV